MAPAKAPNPRDAAEASAGEVVHLAARGERGKKATGRRRGRKKRSSEGGEKEE